jgi:hypothetical protein
MAGQLTIDTLKASSGVLATQNGMTGIAKAWLIYDGSTQTINASFNVSSVTYNAVGDYTVNFTTTLSSANYSAVTSFTVTTGQTSVWQRLTTKTASSVRLYQIINQVGTPLDPNGVNLAVLGS